MHDSRAPPEHDSDDPPGQAECVVIGGGIVGTAAAYHLARDGVDTLLVDRRDKGRATDVGAGILSPATSSRTEDETWFAFATEAVAHYGTLVERLDAAGVSHGYAERDLLSVAATPAEVDAFEDALARTREREADIDGTVEEISPAAARSAFPPLADVERAMRVTGTARVDGGRFADTLRVLARLEEGLRFHGGSVEAVRTADGSVAGVDLADGTTVSARNVVLAGGAWSPELADDVGLALPVEPLRGQIAHLDARPATRSEGDLADWPIVSAFREHYLVPWPNGRVVAGATREPGETDPRTTAGGAREVLNEALRVAPGLVDAKLQDVRVGIRPGTPDGLPVLGEAPDVSGAFLATGHGPTGLMLGPYSGKVVADLVQGESPGVDLEAFAPTRF